MGKLATDVDRASVELLDQKKIAIGKRLRRPGSVSALQRSIEDLGCMHPILVTDNEALTKPWGEKYLLIAGERRMRALKMLGRKIPARIIHSLDDAEILLRMEKEENTERSDMTQGEISTQRRKEVLAVYDEMLAEWLKHPPKRASHALEPGGRVKEGVRKLLLSKTYKKLGIPPQTAARDPGVVKIIENYPELEDFSQRHMEAAAETLDRAPLEDRKHLRAFLTLWPKRAHADAVKSIARIVDFWPPDLRKKLYRVMKDRPEDALSSALGVPPVPDEEFSKLGLVIEDLDEVIKKLGRHKVQSLLRDAKKALEEAHEVLRLEYQEKRNEFEEMLNPEDR